MGKDLRKLRCGLQLLLEGPDDLLMGMEVGYLPPAAHKGAEARRRPAFIPQAVVDHHIGEILIAVGAVGEIDHVRGGASGRAHIDLQPDDLSLFAQIVVIPGQAEKFQMDEAAADPERLQTGAPARLQILRQLVHNVEMDGMVVVDAVHDGDGGDVSGLEKDASFAVYNGVVGADLSRHQLLHNIRNGRKVAEETLQVLFVVDPPGVRGAHTGIRFYDDRVADLPDKGEGALKITDHMVAGSGDAGPFVALLHAGFEFDQRHVFRHQPGGDVKILPKPGVLHEPVFVVALQPVDLSVAEGEKGHRPEHVFVIFHILDPVVFGQGAAQRGREGVVGRISNAQYVDAVGL